MNKFPQSALGPPPFDVSAVEDRLFESLTQAIVDVGKRWRKDPQMTERISKISRLIQKLKDAVKGNDSAWAALVAFDLAKEMFDFDDEKLTQAFVSDRNRIAANVRHQKKQEKFKQAIEAVRLDLEGNCNPEWKHADYTNWILNKLRYSELSRESLKKEIRTLFDDLGLGHRISNCAAKHVKLIK